MDGSLSLGPLVPKGPRLDTSDWRTYKYSDVFDIKNGYYNRKPDHTEVGTIPFIGASMMNNGVTDYYCLWDIENNHKDGRSSEHDLDVKIFKGNSITVANNGVGVGSAFYQQRDFTCSHDVNILYLKEKEMNKYIAMFLCTLIQFDKYRWAYGRKWRPSRMPDSLIKLPSKSRQPNWEFMEQYVSSLQFSSSI